MAIPHSYPWNDMIDTDSSLLFVAPVAKQMEMAFGGYFLGVVQFPISDIILQVARIY